MRTFLRGLVCVTILGVGYWMGSHGVLESRSAHAQLATQDLGKDSQEKIEAAYEALLAAQDALKSEGKYNPATENLNAFAILSGGVDAVNDLETGRGVDPETFAALYAGLANAELRDDLKRDAQGRLTYKNKVVRMYPISRLKSAFANRDSLSGLEN